MSRVNTWIHLPRTVLTPGVDCTPTDNRLLGSCHLSIFPREEQTPADNKLLLKRNTIHLPRKTVGQVKAKMEGARTGQRKWMLPTGTQGDLLKSEP